MKLNAIVIVSIIVLTIAMICTTVFLSKLVVNKTNGKKPLDEEMTLKIEEKENIILLGDGKFVINKANLNGAYKENDQWIRNYFESAIIEDSYIVTGYLENNSQTIVKYVILEFDLFDETGQFLEKAIFNSSTILVGETHKIKAIYFGDEAKNVNSFQLSKATYFTGDLIDSENVETITDIRIEKNSIILDNGKYVLDKSSLKGSFQGKNPYNGLDYYVITGKIKNKSKATVLELNLGFKLFDESGVVLDIAWESIWFDPGKTAKIKASYSGVDAKKVRSFDFYGAYIIYER